VSRAWNVVVDIVSTGDHHELEATTAIARALHDEFFAEIAKV